MSFNVEFTATQADAVKIVEQEHLPPTVRLFVEQALRAFKPAELVYVKAVGHLYYDDYAASSATLVVQLVSLRTPKKP